MSDQPERQPDNQEPQNEHETTNDQRQANEREPEKDDKGKVEWSFDFTFDNIRKGFGDLFNSLAGDTEIKQDSLSEPIGDAQAARMDIDFSLGTGSLRPMSEGDTLIEADLSYVGDIRFEVSGETQKTVKLTQRSGKVVNDVRESIQQGFRALRDAEGLRWDVRVSQNIPLSLNIDGGVGPVILDLSTLKVTDLEIDAGVGTLDVTLPVNTVAYQAEIESGVGRTTLHLLEGTSADLRIEGGVGEVIVTLPPNMAVQLKAKSGLGDIAVPPHFQKIQGGEELISTSGVWQTEGFGLAEQRVMLVYAGGVGRLVIRTAETV